ncbi:TlpA family protein disulfide reductase [Aliifodinibius salicampi]|uniref:TlpA family protein disulfide reductase n=1 Tax=Fodinibius salicampi TaxID=1920655 RepID=A0ABT3PWA8_9BACT|nr:TlpA disulfide reductase family protein [Fodinibius salicampi]MCW9712131.1 TlpA family protein disulfide reductase [Fodinibius salicampi]
MIRNSVAFKSILMVGFVIFATVVVGIAQTTTSDSEPLLKDVAREELQEIINSYEDEKAVLINVWATWCAPCIEEFPHIVELQREYQDEVQVIFISADFPDNRERAIKFLKEQEVDWMTYFKTGKDQPFIEALSENWSGALPFTKILDKDGHVIASWEQGAEYEKFKTNIKKALNN